MDIQKTSLLFALALLATPLQAFGQTPTSVPPVTTTPTPTNASPAAKQAAVTSTLVNGTLTPTPLAFDLGNGRKLTVAGFLQARYEHANTNTSLLPEGGLGTSNGYNGNYLSGTNGDTFKIREARIAFSTVLSRNTKVLAEFGDAGAVNVSSNGNTQVYVRRLFGQYTFGDGSAKYPTVTIGQIPTPFGFALTQLRPVSYQPERPLAFNEGPNGLFANQEQDRGIKLEYSSGKYSLSVAILNGTGTVSNDANRGKDTILRGQYHLTSELSLGASGYLGKFSALKTTGSGQDAVTSTTNSAKKELLGLDAQYTSPVGPFVQAEYVNGKYEALPPYKMANASATPAVTLSDLLPGNKVEGYSLIGGWTFAQKSAHPWSLIAGYDVLKRRKDISSYEDENIGFGGSYNLDRGVRLRAYYLTPNKVAHAPTASDPQKRSLLTLETEFLF